MQLWQAPPEARPGEGRWCSDGEGDLAGERAPEVQGGITGPGPDPGTSW